MFLEISTELLAQGYSVRFRPGGGSMSPTIRDGEAVTVAPVVASQIKRGDIILSQAARGLLAHRVVRIEGAGDALSFITRGDSATSCDAPVRASQVLGRVVCVERNGRPHSLIKRRVRMLQRARLYVSRLRGRRR